MRYLFALVTAIIITFAFVPYASAAIPPRAVTAAVATVGGNSYGGYILYSNGKLVAYGGAPFYGDARSKGLNNFTALGQDGSNNGYWLVTATGKVYTYGNLCQGDVVKEPTVVPPIVGTMFLTAAQQNNGNIDTGFLMVNSKGTVYPYLCEMSF